MTHSKESFQVGRVRHRVLRTKSPVSSMGIARIQPRAGVTLLELLVVISILGVLMALLVPAVQKIRETALFTQGQNQIRQIGLAIHHFSDGHSQRLPRNQQVWERTLLFVPDSAEKIRLHRISMHTTALSSILPYVEETGLYQSVLVQGMMPLRAPASKGFVLAIFQNPLDPSATADPVLSDFTTSYVTNAQVFSMPRSIASGVGDGLSNTIFVSEHYRECQRVYFDLFSQHNLGRWRQKGNFSSPTFADNGYASWFSIFDQPESNDFAPTTSGNPPRSKSAGMVTFQAQPRLDQCDPRLPNSASSRGLQVGMGDGSVRTVHRSIDPYVFWAAVTPDRREVDPPDF